MLLRSDGETARRKSPPGRKAFQRAGFEIIRQSGHIIMSNGRNTIVIPRHNPVNAITMFAVVREPGLTLEQFRKLL